MLGSSHQRFPTNVMGILNVTPDSFYVGSRVTTEGQAIAAGRQMIAEGANVLDVGGESTRPGATPIDIATELARVIPVVEALSNEATVSIDTRHAEVARAAVAAGATIINDVSASLDEVAAESGAGWIAMHMQGTPLTMQDEPIYDDVVEDVMTSLAETAARATAIGVSKVWIDPGIGFGKTARHNLALIAALDRFVATGVPVVLGASRKSFIGLSHARSDRVEQVPAGDRLEGSLAVATWGFLHHVDLVRVHDVRATVECAQVVGIRHNNEKATAA